MVEQDWLKDIDASIVPDRFGVLEPTFGAELIELLVARFLDDFFLSRMSYRKS